MRKAPHHAENLKQQLTHHSKFDGDTFCLWRMEGVMPLSIEDDPAGKAKVQDIAGWTTCSATAMKLFNEKEGDMPRWAVFLACIHESKRSIMLEALKQTGKWGEWMSPNQNSPDIGYTKKSKSIIWDECIL